MSVRRETVSVTLEELYSIIDDYIMSNHPEIAGCDLEYTSKTTFLTFDVIRPGKKQ